MQWTFVKVLKDNYVWVLYNSKKEAIVIDCGDFETVKSFLDEKGLNLKYILMTHAHYDHVDGVKELAQYSGALIVGNGYFSDRFPKLDIPIMGIEERIFLDSKVKVLPTPGHCGDHISYYFQDLNLLFVGDLLFSLGCGRIFEGEPEGLLNSFDLLQDIPNDALIFPAHEYTKANLEFVKSLNFFDLEGEEERILINEVTVPSSMGFERKCNPFLNINNQKFKESLSSNPSINRVDFYNLLRYMKNKFSYIAIK